VICQFVSPKIKIDSQDFSVHRRDLLPPTYATATPSLSFATIAIEEETTNSAATSIACVVGVDDI
jgi:hypothetical protein